VPVAQPTAQMPSAHTVPAPQRAPQTPQLFGSERVSAQSPAQSVVPAAQPTAHTPSRHTVPAPQRAPQTPQLLGSVRASTQDPSHSSRLESHVEGEPPPPQPIAMKRVSEQERASWGAWRMAQGSPDASESGSVSCRGRRASSKHEP